MLVHQHLEDGMTYVALSRVTSITGLHLINFDKSKIKADGKAITEYNRLRQLYTTHLGTLTTTHKNQDTANNKDQQIHDAKRKNKPHNKKEVVTKKRKNTRNITLAISS
jgi:hypothetical protein